MKKLLNVWLVLFLFCGCVDAKKLINLKLEDLTFQKTELLESTIRVDLTKNEAEFINKSRWYLKPLQIDYTPGTMGGYFPASRIGIVCPNKKIDKDKLKKTILLMETSTIKDSYYAKELAIYFEDLNSDTVIIKVSAGFFGVARLKDKPAIHWRLSENERIFNRILESIEIRGEDGNYFKPQIERLPDKIEDSRKKTKNDPMWEGII
jgi:hypothetical protein